MRNVDEYDENVDECDVNVDEYDGNVDEYDVTRSCYYDHESTYNLREDFFFGKTIAKWILFNPQRGKVL